jgi:hypothetical protein
MLPATHWAIVAAALLEAQTLNQLETCRILGIDDCHKALQLELVESDVG